MAGRIRVLIAKPGLDGHDRGAKVVARGLRDAGMEVVYSGLHRTPSQIVRTAVDEDVQVVGLSILSGAHNRLLPAVVEGLRAEIAQQRDGCEDPERDDALVVAVEMRNTAPFPQAFPIMVLSFNSSSNQLIALREFYPEEYLDPGLREVTMMPVMSPVQVSLEIIDPGGDAVNYTMAFRLP